MAPPPATPRWPPRRSAPSSAPSWSISTTSRMCPRPHAGVRHPDPGHLHLGLRRAAGGLGNLAGKTSPTCIWRDASSPCLAWAISWAMGSGIRMPSACCTISWSPGGQAGGLLAQRGYEFDASKALIDDGRHFVGLALDDANQYDQTESRIEQWVGRPDPERLDPQNCSGST